MDVMLMDTPVSFRNPNEQIRLKGMVVITITENFTDSNWAAITTKIRNTATAMAWYREENSSFIIRSILLVPLFDGSSQIRGNHLAFDLG